MARYPGVSPVLAALIWGVLPVPGLAQGGWRQWDVYLRDGTRVEANPLGAPDSTHISLSVGGFQGHEPGISRSRIDYIAAQTTVGPRREPIAGAALPKPPLGRVCQDLVILLDGRRTSGRVSLARVVFSEGVVRQRGVDIDLSEVAYIKFAHAPAAECRRKRPAR